ncbi:MAG: hypothetical protein E6J78_16945 [Deltaproteobacteria bacterium]|nr:MAG: hypothetical protein E6J78_16945 [Deltaproteobacteria bacterium]
MKRPRRRVMRRARRRRRSRIGWLFAALAVCCALWFWQRPAPPSPPADRPRSPPRAAALPPPRRLAHPIPTAPRDLLLAALRSRAVELRDCPQAADGPHQIATRLDLSRAGSVRAVAFDSSEPLPRDLADCVRSRMLAWRLDEVPLRSDLQALLTLEMR